MSEIASLKNLGAKSAHMLAEAGILTVKDLRVMGPARAFLAVRQAGLKPSLNLLWAVAGGLDNRHWLALSASCKNRLLRQVRTLAGDVSD